jgi:ABC transporter substrate binding protein
MVTDAKTAASAMGWQVEIVKASTNREIDSAFSVLKEKRVDALLVAPDTLLANRRVQIAMLAVRDAIPLMAVQRELAEAGGLMSYGTNFMETYRQTGIYTGRILKGAKPADLPASALRPPWRPPSGVGSASAIQTCPMQSSAARRPYGRMRGGLQPTSRPIIDEIIAAGAASHNAIAAKLNERNVCTARGGAWTHVQVGAILHPFGGASA